MTNPISEIFGELLRSPSPETLERWAAERREKRARFIIAGLSVALLLACLVITFLVTH